MTKCVSGETKVFTDKGFVPIREFGDSKEKAFLQHWLDWYENQASKPPGLAVLAYETRNFLTEG